MADSTRLAVVKAVADALRGMTDPAAYNFPVADPASVTIDPTANVLTSPGADAPYYVVEVSPDGQREFWPASQITETIRGSISGRVDVADVSDPDSRAAAWEGMAADLEKALTADVTLGGLVYDVRLLVPAPFVGVGSPVVVLVQPWEARVYRTYGRP